METAKIKSQRRFVFFIVLAISLFGILMVYESSSIYAFHTTGNAAYFFYRQIIFLLVGLFMFGLMLLLDLEFLRRYNKECLITAFVLLAVNAHDKIYIDWLSIAAHISHH